VDAPRADKADVILALNKKMFYHTKRGFSTWLELYYWRYSSCARGRHTQLGFDRGLSRPAADTAVRRADSAVVAQASMGSGRAVHVAGPRAGETGKRNGERLEVDEKPRVAS
jgi:hypothetical protein